MKTLSQRLSDRYYFIYNELIACDFYLAKKFEIDPEKVDFWATKLAISAVFL